MHIIFSSTKLTFIDRHAKQLAEAAAKDPHSYKEPVSNIQVFSSDKMTHTAAIIMVLNRMLFSLVLTFLELLKTESFITVVPIL